MSDQVPRIQDAYLEEADSASKKRKLSKDKRDLVDEGITANRKIGQASRTLKACDLCRKQKTRCFRSPEKPSSCLRCTFLNKTCSFETSPDVLTTAVKVDDGNKLDLIYSGINEVLSLLKGKENSSKSRTHVLRETAIENLNDSPHTKYYDQQPTIISPSNAFKASPFSLMTNHSQVPRPIRRLLRTSLPRPILNDDIISRGILPQSRVIELLDDFRRNYGRWVLFPLVIPTVILVERVRGRSSFLLTTCCCISLRFSLQTRENILLYRELLKHLVKDMNKALINYTSFPDSNEGDIEFLQALVILSIYSYSLTSMLGQIPEEDITIDESGIDISTLNLDAWYLSSIGLTTCISKSTFGRLFANPSSNKASPDFSITILFDELNDENQKLTILRIYNHLCLVHLINCVFSGRMCTIDEIRINYCGAALSLPNATNFDGRMVSEIGILLIAYNYIQSNLNEVMPLDECIAGFEQVKEELTVWYNQWEYLINQPAIQFVEFNYHVCSLVIYYNFNYFKNGLECAQKFGPTLPSLFEEDNLRFILKNCDPESLIQMIHHAHEAVRFVKAIESDSYFAYLSDQLHFCFYFCGVMAVHLVKWLTDSNQGDLLEKLIIDDDEDEILNNRDKGTKSHNFEIILHEVNYLIHKFQLIGQDNANDILTSYHLGLELCVRENFPYFKLKESSSVDATNGYTAVIKNESSRLDE